MSEGINDKPASKRTDGIINVVSAVPKRRQELLRWNGWGYKDSRFVVKDRQLCFVGERYLGEMKLPYFTKYAADVVGIDVSAIPQKEQPLPESHEYPARISADIIEGLKKTHLDYSLDVVDRLIRAHGQTLHDIATLRWGKFDRIPDAVVWLKNHQETESIVKFAYENDLVLIPYGGGTAVSGAAECPNDPRTIIAVDTSQMNRILWVDRENLVACCESGIIGQDLERELKKLGFTSGHEPDSYEFSSLGGWVATRASGMKKNVYGNIEDLLVHVRMVTCKGTLEKNCQVPRMSCGPDFNHLILGSEGSLGIITEVIIKIRPVPECQRYNSIIFPNFESGVQCMRLIAKERCQPASVRLMDNEQFKFGQSLKPIPTWWQATAEMFKKFYVTKIKSFDVDHMCVMTLLFEGDKDEVQRHEKKIVNMALQFGGMAAGSTYGMRGYLLTFVIAYIRDIAYDFNVIAESFETSVPWDRAIQLCTNVKRCINDECARRGIVYKLVSCRVTQTYDAGCVIYFYFGFHGIEGQNKEAVYAEIEDIARDEIVASGGSISHHHGVGKLRRKWYGATVSDVGVRLFAAAKKELDPRNVFATGNLVDLKSKL